MTGDLINHPIVSIGIGVVAALVGKFLWERYFSQESRVTLVTCGLRQKACRDELLAQLKAADLARASIEKKRNEDEQCNEHAFTTLDQCITVIMMTQMKICEKLQIDCGEITKVMVKKGILD